MIKVLVPVKNIPLARSIEGRKFKEGFWYFPESSLDKLKKSGLIDSDYKTESKTPYIEYEMSNHVYNYQRDIINKALNSGSYGIFADTGTGKTIMGLEIASKHKKTLVVSPLSIMESSWISDCNKFYNMRIVSLWATSKEKRISKLNEEADIYIVNYEGIKILYNQIIKANFDCIIVDESSKIKNMNAQITSTILSLKEVIPKRFVLSGCPTPNHNKEIFPQMKFIDEEIFGSNYHGFLAKYFSQDMQNPHLWYQSQENKDNYFQRLREKSVFLDKNDCVDLPDKIFITREFDLNREQLKHYNDILNDIKSNINQWSKFEFTAKLMKLREIVSGFVIDKNNEVINFKTAKDLELESTLEDIGDKQVIIWCQFKHEIERLSEKFNGVGVTSKTKDRNKIIEDFKQGKIKRIFVHPKLFGMGLTFTNCTYNIYYSLSFSYEEFKQSQDRIHRIGQKNKCTYIILKSKNTIDDFILKSLRNKKSAVDELYYELSSNIV